MGWWKRFKRRVHRFFFGRSSGSNSSGNTPGTISLTAQFMFVNENVGVLRVALQRSGGNAGAVSVDYNITPLSAVPGVDYVAVSGTMSWPNGNQNQVTINIPIVNNFGPDTDRAFRVNIFNEQGGAALGNDETTVSIIDDDTGVLSTAVFRPNSLSYEVSEAAGFLRIKVSRLGSAQGAVTVNYHTVNGSASAGTHYTNTSGTLSWNDLESGDKFFDVPITDVPGAGGDKVFTVVLDTVTGDAVIDVGYDTVTVTILDDESVSGASPGTVKFVSATYSAAEGSGTLKIQVSRVGGSFGAISVDYEAVDGTAQNGDEFDLVADSLSWANGESGPLDIDITLNDDSIPFGNKSFQVVLSGLTGGATLGTDTAAITILDDDALVDYIDADQNGVHYRETQITDTERDVDVRSPCSLHRPFGMNNDDAIALGPSKPTKSRRHANDLYKDGANPLPRPRAGRVQIKEIES